MTDRDCNETLRELEMFLDGEMTTEELTAALTGLGAMRRIRTEMADSGLVVLRTDADEEPR